MIRQKGWNRAKASRWLARSSGNRWQPSGILADRTGERRRSAWASSALPGPEAGDREEARWQREEQRWLREEERWLREQARWQEEERRLQAEVDRLAGALAEAYQLMPAGEYNRGPSGGFKGADLDAEVLYRKLEESRRSFDTLPSASAAQVATPVASAAPLGSLADAGVPLARPLVPPPPAAAVPGGTAAAQAPAAGPANGFFGEGGAAATPPPPPAARQGVAPERQALRVGAEGEPVRQLQEALQLLGFYPGEEDMEGSYFSQSTESAVKTWQATVAVREDGIMTAEHLIVLFDQAQQRPTLPTSPPKAAAPAQKPAAAFAAAAAHRPNAPAATREVPEIERYARSSVEMGERRVFLLGENRWEDPNRLTAAAAAAGKASGAGGAAKGMKLVLAKCHACRGDGSVVCMECEGTGELNVEEQFLDWVATEGGELPHCLYCDGKGAVVCDTCKGSGLASGS